MAAITEKSEKFAPCKHPDHPEHHGKLCYCGPCQGIEETPCFNSMGCNNCSGPVGDENVCGFRDSICEGCDMHIPATDGCEKGFEPDPGDSGLSTCWNDYD